MPVRQGERRRSRASFAKTLSRIAERISVRPVYDLEWNDELLHTRHRRRVNIGGLWVAGSYARGALDCGDLDILVNLGIKEYPFAGSSKISRAVIGHAPDVRLYIGTPEENSSGIAFPEAKLIWSPAEPDWQAAILAIPADPSATHYPRRHDELPLRTEQFYLLNDLTLDQLLDLKDDGCIAWVWVPADEIHIRPKKWSDGAREFATDLRRWCGKKTQSVMQLAIEYYEQNGNYTMWRREWNDKVHFRLGSAHIFAGRPPVNIEMLDDLSCSSVVIAPHLSRRGPNGLWIISRGINHPLAQAFSEGSAYYLGYEGQPEIIVEWDDWRSGYALELFQSRELAKERATEAKTDDDADLDVMLAVGGDLLNLIAAVDFIEIGETHLELLTK